MRLCRQAAPVRQIPARAAFRPGARWLLLLIDAFLPGDVADLLFNQSNGRMIIEEHLMDEAAGLAPVGHRDDLTAFGVVTEAG